MSLLHFKQCEINDSEIMSGSYLTEYSTLLTKKFEYETSFSDLVKIVRISTI